MSAGSFLAAPEWDRFKSPPLFIVANRRANAVKVVPFAAQGLHLDSARIDWLFRWREEDQKLPTSENPESRWSRDGLVSGLIIKFRNLCPSSKQ